MLLVLTFTACEFEGIDEESVVHLRFVGKREANNCTGFFSSENVVTTAKHCIPPKLLRTEMRHIQDGEVYETEEVFIDVSEGDVVTINTNVAGLPVPWCQANIGARAFAYGWLKYWEYPDYSEGRVVFRKNNRYYTSTKTGHGWSGGPVVSARKNCVLGVTEGEVYINGRDAGIAESWR
jgi:hypothetical protein